MADLQLFLYLCLLVYRYELSGKRTREKAQHKVASTVNVENQFFTIQVYSEVCVSAFAILSMLAPTLKPSRLYLK
jgi:hypothetical protein